MEIFLFNLFMFFFLTYFETNDMQWIECQTGIQEAWVEIPVQTWKSTGVLVALIKPLLKYLTYSENPSTVAVNLMANNVSWVFF